MWLINIIHRISLAYAEILYYVFGRIAGEIVFLLTAIVGVSVFACAIIYFNELMVLL